MKETQYKPRPKPLLCSCPAQQCSEVPGCVSAAQRPCLGQGSPLKHSWLLESLFFHGHTRGKLGAWDASVRGAALVPVLAGLA